MKAQIAVKLEYDAAAPCTVLMQIAAHHGTGQIVLAETLDMTPQDRNDIPGDAGYGTRSWMTVNDRLQVNYRAQVQVSRPAPDWDNLQTTPLSNLPPEAVTYLMSSRYCPADAFLDSCPRPLAT